VSHPDYRFGNSPDFALEEVGVFPDDGEDGDGDNPNADNQNEDIPGYDGDSDDPEMKGPTKGPRADADDEGWEEIGWPDEDTDEENESEVDPEEM